MRSRDILLLFGLVIVAFGASLASNVLTDDLILIRNARLSTWSLGDLCTSFRLEHKDYTSGWLPSPFNDFSLQYFRPVIMASIKLDSALWDSWTPGYHITNIVIYGVMVSIVLLWGRDFGLYRRDRMLFAALFVLYAPNQMAVNIVASRTELVADVFMLSSVICLGRFYGSRNPVLFGGALLAGILALGSKENAVMLPFLHGVAAFLLYRPMKDKKSGGTRVRIVSLLPFFLMIPGYFYVRAAVLGGFPEPLKGFYFHHPLDPGFAPFLLSKLIHAALTLVYQFPILLPPVMIEYSIPTAIITGLIAVATLAAVYRETRPPFRFFMLFWIGICIAPTLPMGLNPIYYFLCSPVMAVFYVMTYRKYAASPIRWQMRTAKVLLVSALAFGLLNCAGGGLNARLIGEASRNIARDTLAVLEAKPAVDSVYLLDLPPSGFDVVPAIRFQNEAHSGKKFFLLAPRAHLFDPSPCEITQVDAYSFDLRPTSGTLLRTGIEEAFLANPLPEFRPGMTASHPEYEMEVLEAGFGAGNDEASLLTRLRSHYRMPRASQNGVAVLRFRFRAPLAAANRLFLQVTESGTREINFLNEAELQAQRARPTPGGEQ